MTKTVSPRSPRAPSPGCSLLATSVRTTDSPYKATRLKGQTINEPVEVSLNLHGLNRHLDPVYQTIGTVDSKGTLRIQYGLNLNQPRLDIGYETLVWLLGVSTDQDFEMPDNLQIINI